MANLRRVCVFCGSSTGTRPEYAAMARALGRQLAREKVGLCFGGGRVGLMGVVADAAMEAGGEVIGVIPKHLEAKELGHLGITELRVVGSMHERKAMMADLSDAFVALPGGVGTLEELFEVATWGLLGIHQKPVALLDVQGYYGALGQFLDHAVREGFLAQVHRDALAVRDSPESLLEYLRAWQPSPQVKWLDRSER
jgi:uncharacterized protein (TIGR00730 family)